MKKERRLIALSVCAAFVIVMLFASLFLVHEGLHDCVGAGCVVCAQIAGRERTMKLAAVPVVTVGAAVIPVFLANVSFGRPVAAVGQDSLVLLKIKLSD